MITWKFNELDITFKSKAPNLFRDFSKMAYANGIGQDAEITIINVNGNTNNTFSTDPASISSDTSNVSQSTIPMGSENISYSKSETTELPSMSSNVDNVDPESNDLELFDTANDLERPGDFDVDQPDGQDTH